MKILLNAKCSKIDIFQYKNDCSVLYGAITLSSVMIRILCIVIMLMGVSASFAQDRKFLNPQLKFSAEYLPQSKFKGDSAEGKFSMTKAYAGFVFPVISRRYALTNDLTYKSLVLLVNANANYTLPNITFLENKHRFLSATAGPSLIFNSGNKNTWLAGFAAGIAQDMDIFSEITIRFTGHALFKRKVSGNFSYHLGAVYSYVYAQPALLPLLGCVIRTSDKSKLKISLPVSVSFYYKTNEYDMLSVFIRPDGDQYMFSGYNEPMFAASDPLSLRMRYRSFKTGFSYEIGLSNRLLIKPEVGMALNRRLSFTEGEVSDKSNIFKSDLHSAPYVKFAFRILLGDTRWRRNGDNFLLNDERLDYYDLDDPTKL
ncbi:MAG: hypothetical protein FNNCIFGK_00027 [Bacteroidia bacterium]|nr:hypothetical protein [Bacteroidia bacterium]